MKNILFLLFFLLLVACVPVGHEVEVSVVNNSDADIREITFFTTNNKEVVKFDQLRPNESTSVTVDVKNYDADGNFTFEYIDEKGEKRQTTGNYFEEDFEQFLLNFSITDKGIDVNNKPISKASF